MKTHNTSKESAVNNQLESIALFYIGLCSQFLGLILLVFCIYILPYLFFNLNYSVPTFVFQLRMPYEGNYNFDAVMQLLAVFTPTAVCGFLLLFIAKRITIRLEIQHLPKDDEKRTTHYVSSLPWYVIGLLVVALILLFAAFQAVVISDYNEISNLKPQEIRNL